MGWLNRLWGKDPAEELARIERWLAEGDPVRAVQAARRLERHRDMAIQGQATSLLQQARDALVERTVSNAAAAEKAGDLADAADWIQAALQHLGDGVQRAELEARLETLESRMEEEAPAPRLLHKDEPEAPEAYELDVDTRYDMLTSMLVDEVARRYENRSPELRQAVVDLNEARVQEALPVLDGLVARSSSDPVLHFERGRARLMLEKWAGAREDLEAAWTRLGDAPLDRGGSLSIPLLWAEAVLNQGDTAALLDRLAEEARPDAGNPDLSALYAQALVSEGRRDEARELWIGLRERHPQRQDIAHALAAHLAEEGETQAAIRVLEVAVAPSCASGSCSKPPLHLPSLRLLVNLYLESKGPLPRIEELMAWVAHAQKGRMAAPDHRLLARYHELTGDSRAAEEARLNAERLEREARPDLEHHPDVPGGDLSRKNQEMPI